MPNEQVNLSLDPESFETMFRQHYLRLQSYAYSIVGDEAQAEEVVQAVFVQLWEKREEQPIKTSVKAYLFKAVYHRALNQKRHQKVKEAYSDYQKAHSPNSAFQDPAEANELKSRIEAAIGMLPPRCQQVFRLSRFEGLSYQEIAKELDISVKTVEVQMGKALRMLRESLQDYLPLFLLFLIKHWPGG